MTRIDSPTCQHCVFARLGPARSGLAVDRLTVWHLAPQVILPSRHGRLPFSGRRWAGWRRLWRSGVEDAGLRATLVSHLLTDASGVRAACYRLRRPDAAAEA